MDFLEVCSMVEDTEADLALAEDILGYLGFLISFHYSLPTKVVYTPNRGVDILSNGIRKPE